MKKKAGGTGKPKRLEKVKIKNKINNFKFHLNPSLVYKSIYIVTPTRWPLTNPSVPSSDHASNRCCFIGIPLFAKCHLFNAGIKKGVPAPGKSKMKSAGLCYCTLSWRWGLERLFGRWANSSKFRLADKLLGSVQSRDWKQSGTEPCGELDF